MSYETIVQIELGSISRKEGKLKDAIRYFTKEIGLSPSDPTAYIERGLTHKGNGSFKAALDDYNNPIAYHNRALLYWGKALPERAFSDIKNALKQSPFDPDYICKMV